MGLAIVWIGASFPIADRLALDHTITCFDGSEHTTGVFALLQGSHFAFPEDARAGLLGCLECPSAS
jgi:hypothetical protein